METLKVNVKKLLTVKSYRKSLK